MVWMRRLRSGGEVDRNVSRIILYVPGSSELRNQFTDL